MSDQPSSPESLLSTLHTRITTLYSEILAFKSTCTNLAKPIYIARLENEVRRELSRIERAISNSASPPSGGWNISKFEAVWTHAKRCEGVVALRKAFTSGKRASVLVDVVAGEGREWVKVYTTSERRVLFDLAKNGWLYPEDESGSEDDGEFLVGERQEDEIGLVERVKGLVAVAKEYRVKCQHPQIRIILSRIHEGRVPEIDKVISDLRATGAKVESQKASDSLATDVSNLTLQPPSLNQISEPNLPSPLNAILANMVFPLPPTPTLNIDTSLLIALISSISHTHPSSLIPQISPGISPGRRRLIQRQLDAEQHHALVPERLYPVLGGRELVCTEEAARVTREITETIGTGEEVGRLRVLFGNGEEKEDELRRQFQELSGYPVPDTLRLPVKIVPFDVNTYLSAGQPPPETPESHPPPPSGPLLISHLASQTARIRHLSPLNTSVFAFGWSRDLTTLTRSFMVAGAIEATVGELFDEIEQREGVDPLDMEGMYVPRMMVVDVERGLFGRQDGDEGRRVVENRNLEAERAERKERRRVLRGAGAAAVRAGVED